jgi:hypothetical protein
VNFQTDQRSVCPITCIAPSSETTTGGVYKWQGRNRHSLMSCAYEAFLVARPIIAILGPNWVDVIPVFPPSFGSSGSDQKVGILVLTDIVVRVSPRTLRSITDLLLPKISPDAKSGILQRRGPPKRLAGMKRVHPTKLSSLTILSPTGQLGSRPLTESTKQITPPTKSGHAPPFKGSRKNTQSVNPHPVRIW